MKLHNFVILVLTLSGVMQAMDIVTPPSKKKVCVNAEIRSKSIPKDISARQTQMLAERETVSAINQRDQLPDLATLFDHLTLSSFRYLEESAADSVWLLRKLLYAIVKVDDIYEQVKKDTTAYAFLTSKTLSLITNVSQLGCAQTAFPSAGPDGNWKEAQALRAEKELFFKAAASDLETVVTHARDFLIGYTTRLKNEVSQAFDELEQCNRTCEKLTQDILSLETEKASMLRPSQGNSARITHIKRIAEWQNNINAKDQAILDAKEALAKAQEPIPAVCRNLGTSLWNFKQKTFHIAANRGCAKFNMAALPEALILKIFNCLEKLEKNQEFFKQCNEALLKFKSNEGLYTGLVYTLQQYICCAYYAPEKISAKGPAWEILTTLFLHESLQNTSFGTLVTMNDIVSHSRSISDNGLREFDILTDEYLFECKSGLWDWDCRSHNKEIEQQKKRRNAKLQDQILSQRAIATSYKKQYAVISKQPLDKGWSTWFRSKNIICVDPTMVTCSFIKNVAQLYQKPYFIQ